MAWNPSKRVAAARDIGLEFGFDQVIIIGIDTLKGTMILDSYGKTRKSGDEIKVLADAAYDAIFDKKMEEIGRNELLGTTGKVNKS